MLYPGHLFPKGRYLGPIIRTLGQVANNAHPVAVLTQRTVLPLPLTLASASTAREAPDT